jgi:hypothetical protein
MEDLEPRLIWIFGSPRSGSTWLTQLLGAHPAIHAYGEPHIGVHVAPFAPSFYRSEPLLYPEVQASRPEYFFNTATAGVWRPALRSLILARIGADAEPGKVLAIKEPHGSQAADMIMSTLPKSRLLFLLRDGRDVVDSEVAALEPDAWMGRGFDVQVPRLQLVEQLSRIWRVRTEVVERAYEGHDPSLRFLLRYEDLLADPTGRLTDLLGWLGLPAGAPRVRATVDRFDFGSIRTRGPTSFHRSARPGAWRENLNAAEQERMAELLEEPLGRLGYLD